MNHPIVQRAEILLNQKRYRQAVDELSTYLASYPQDYVASYYLANAYLLNDQGKEARAIAEGLLNENPESTMVIYLLAQIDILEERYDEAERKALALIEMEVPIEDHSAIATWRTIDLLSLTDA